MIKETKRMKNEAEWEAPSLCDELVADILIRVTPKTLSRCKCVCKNWRNLISSTYVVQALKSGPPISAGFFYLECSDNDRVKYYCSIDRKVYHNVIPPDDLLTMPFSVVASHNGLVLCAEKTKVRQRHFICNPYTMQWVFLPRNPNLPEAEADGNDFILLCIEKQESCDVEFKVLNFSFWTHWDSNPCSFLQVHMYSSETGKWTISELFSLSNPRFHSFRLEGSKKTLLAPDFVYLWKSHFSKVCVYDLNRGSLHVIRLPKPSAERFSPSHHLGVSVGSVYYAEVSTVSIRIWVHGGGDKWSLEHFVSFREVPRLKFDPSFRLIAINPMKLGLVMQGDTKEQVLIYHVNRREMELVPDFHPSLNDMPIVPYMLPGWLPGLKNSVSMKRGAGRSPLSLHEEVNYVKKEEDFTILFVPQTRAYNRNFPPLSR
ncbi:hypothetical protein ACHQM5_013863 [Ranunculus cassubicifolius]